MLIPHHLVQMIDAAALSVAVYVRLSPPPVSINRPEASGEGRWWFNGSLPHWSLCSVQLGLSVTIVAQPAE